MSVAAVTTINVKLAPKFANWFGSPLSVGSVTTILGRVNFPSASLQRSGRPA